MEQIRAQLPPGEDWILGETRVVKDTRRDALHTLLTDRRTIVVEVDFIAARNLPEGLRPVPSGPIPPS